MQCIQLQVGCDCSENGFHFKLEEKKSIDFGIVTFVSKTTWFLLHQGVVLKSSFYCTYQRGTLKEESEFV